MCYTQTQRHMEMDLKGESNEREREGWDHFRTKEEGERRKERKKP